MPTEKQPLVYAHRGASGSYFENTMRAFDGAIKEGADGLEIDVQISKDGEFFVIHDSDLYRLTGKRLNISDLEATEIQELRVGPKYKRKIKGNKIPSLASVISFALLHSISLNVELKETFSARPESLPKLLDELAVLSDLHISSFDYEIVKKVKLLNPSLEVALLIKKKMLKNKTLNEYEKADAFHIHKKLLSQSYMSMWKKANKPIRIYGVEGKESYICKPPDFVVGWITDFPRRLSC